VALLETLLPRLAIDLSKRVVDLALLYPHPVAEMRLEIGFGSGEHLINQAKTHPHTGFIGVEPFVNGMAKALASLADHSLCNIRLHHGDASELLAWLPDCSIDGIDLLYPDPWPKRRHWKRRFVQEESIAVIARILRPGAEFRFATDVPNYAGWTLKHFLHSPAFEWTAECAADWSDPWLGFSATRYEAKAKRQGCTPCYLVFRKMRSKKPD
jgi:tRNA (guanine-N7-)-methyltransferase